MAWMTTALIKTYNNITVTDYDTRIDLFNPMAENRVISYIRRPDQDTCPLGYEYDYARFVWLYVSQGDSTKTGKDVKSKSIDGESISYGDINDMSNASTIKSALAKFKPLQLRYV